MAEDFFLSSLGIVANLSSAIFIPIATLILGRKLLKDKKETGKYNIIRLIIFLSFLNFSILAIIEFLLKNTPLIPPFIEELYSAEFGFYNTSVAIRVTLGLTLIFYINRWEILHFSAIFFFIGMLFLYLFTGFSAWLENYTIIAGVASILFLYFTAFRMKDNGALSIAIFFTLTFSIQFISEALVSEIIIISYVAFVVIFSLGLFRPYKQEVNT
ncbi:MAG: hypothetical protein KGD68_00785 [Candidatus Lokiarchaeota archaeon]|nr:hypothetical protein [Candidatus Lokiarchaeota archaeon]